MAPVVLCFAQNKHGGNSSHLLMGLAGGLIDAERIEFGI